MTKARQPSVLVALILPIYIPSMLASIGMGITLLVIPLLVIEMTGSYSIASLVFAMLGLGTLLFDIPAGMLVSRVGIKAAMFMGTLTVSGATFLAGLIDSVWVLSILILLLGAGRGLMMLVRMTYLADCTTAERGRAMATVGGVMRIGGLLGPLIGGFSAKYMGYEVTLVLAGMIMATALGFVTFLPAGGKVSSHEHTQNPLDMVIKTVVNYRSIFMTAGVAAFGLQLIRSGRNLMVPLWGTAIGLDAAEIGLISGIPMALELMMFYPVGVIMDRYGRKWTSVPCITFLALGLFLMPLCHSFGPFLLVALIAGFGNGLGNGIFITLGADFSPVDGRSSFLSVWRLVGDSGHMLSPFFIGLLTTSLALPFAFYSIASIGFVAAAVMLFTVKESRVSPAS